MQQKGQKMLYTVRIVNPTVAWWFVILGCINMYNFYNWFD